MPGALPLRLLSLILCPLFSSWLSIISSLSRLYLWWSETSLSALCDRVFLSIYKSVCVLTSVREHLPGHASEGQTEGVNSSQASNKPLHKGEWGGLWSLPINWFFSSEPGAEKIGEPPWTNAEETKELTESYSQSLLGWRRDLLFTQALDWLTNQSVCQNGEIREPE